MFTTKWKRQNVWLDLTQLIMSLREPEYLDMQIVQTGKKKVLLSQVEKLGFGN